MCTTVGRGGGDQLCPTAAPGALIPQGPGPRAPRTHPHRLGGPLCRRLAPGGLLEASAFPGDRLPALVLAAHLDLADVHPAVLAEGLPAVRQLGQRGGWGRGGLSGGRPAARLCLRGPRRGPRRGHGTRCQGRAAPRHSDVALERGSQVNPSRRAELCAELMAPRLDLGSSRDPELGCGRARRAPSSCWGQPRAFIPPPAPGSTRCREGAAPLRSPKDRGAGPPASGDGWQQHGDRGKPPGVPPPTPLKQGPAQGHSSPSLPHYAEVNELIAVGGRCHRRATVLLAPGSQGAWRHTGHLGGLRDAGVPRGAGAPAPGLG